ncbi:ATP-binding cassette domain-containing protein [bacterium]|nr:ATP-binding cassette domain-containing protein [bacterium]
MIQIRNLSYSIGERPLLKSVQWMIHPGRHMALIGPNGAGKTTLFRILHGDIKPDTGEMIMPRGTSVGYLPQEEIVLHRGTLIESVMQRQQELSRIEKQLAEVHALLSGNTDPPKELLDKLGRLEHHYAALGGYELEHQAKQILSGLGFQEHDHERPIAEFSGGWRMRAVLASLLLQDPDVLLLDEPTNHLDLPSLEWLEQYLVQFSGSVVIVSHDRFFIDRLATDIYELERGKLTHYAGNYHFYERKKAENLELLKKQQREQEEEIRRQQAFIDRFRYKATKAAQVQSRIKMLEKIERIELPDERRNWSFRISVSRPSYKDVLHIRDMSFRYDRDWVLKDIDLSVYRNDKIAMVGENGAGKTTLTRLIYGDFKPQAGTVTLGQNVETGYYSQHQIDALDLGKTVIEEVSSFAAEAASVRIRNVLGIFQFSGDDVYKKIRVLSGGEKARVSLAKMLLSEANFLIMDEPTNHLDIVSKEALEHALEQYDGTLLLISHDRYFLTKLVHKVIEVKDHSLRIFEGNYNDYLGKRLEAEMSGQDQKAETKVPGVKPAARKSREQRRQDAESRDALNRLKKPYEQKVRQIEVKIGELEKQKQDLESRMADPDTYDKPGLIRELQQEHARLDKDLKTHYASWEQAQDELDTCLNNHL